MTAVLPLAATGFNFTVDPDTGMFRSAANEQTIKCGGINVVKITTTGIFDGVSGADLGFVVGVPYLWMFSTAPAGCVFLFGQPCTASTPRIRQMLVDSGSPFGNNGTDPLFPDMRGVAVAGRGDMGGVQRGILTGATLGAFLGTQTVALTGNQNGTHVHTGSGATAAENVTHTHTGSGNTGTVSAFHTHPVVGSTGSESADHVHVYQQPALSPVGGLGGSLNVVSGLTPTNTAGVSANHTHGISITSGTESQNHTHPFSFTTSTESAAHSHTFAFTTASSGLGEAHPNVQPTLVMNYIMRTA